MNFSDLKKWFKCLNGIRTWTIKFKSLCYSLHLIFSRKTSFSLRENMKWHPDKDSMCPTSQRDSDILNQIKGGFIVLWSYTEVERFESLTLSGSITGETYLYLDYSLEDLTSMKITIINYMIYWSLLSSKSSWFKKIRCLSISWHISSTIFAPVFQKYLYNISYLPISVPRFGGYNSK